MLGIILFWIAITGSIVSSVVCIVKRTNQYEYIAAIFAILATMCAITSLVIFDEHHPWRAVGIYQNSVSKHFAVQHQKQYWTPVGIVTDSFFGHEYVSYADALEELELDRRSDNEQKPNGKWIPIIGDSNARD
jgi:uncharacterized membrane protein YbjE (DUF340 family)